MEPLKKKKRNLWVLHLGYEGENKSKRKEKGKYCIGNTCTWTRFIGTVATQISLFRNSKLVRTTYFYSYVHLESCHLLLARYFVKYPGGVYSDNSNNWKSFLSSKFRTWTGSNCASIHSNFDLQKYNPFKIKDTPPFIHLHYLSEARWWCKTTQGEEEERRGARKIGLVISQKFMDWRVQGRGRGTQLGEFPRQKAIDRGGWEETRR